MALALRYIGHEPGVSMGYFTGACVTLSPGQTFPLPEEGLVLGRRASASLRVASSIVAPHHCSIVPTGHNTASLVDLGSTNGTRVRGETVESCALRVGDRITLAEGFHFELVLLP